MSAVELDLWLCVHSKHKHTQIRAYVMVRGSGNGSTLTRRKNERVRTDRANDRMKLSTVRSGRGSVELGQPSQRKQEQMAKAATAIHL
jgi:hypothetical protein